MKISSDSGEGWQALLASDYVDPRDLKPSSPLRALAAAYLQDLRDRGRGERTIPKYAAYLHDFCSFLERGDKTPRISDVDIRSLKAYGSHLTRRQARGGLAKGKRSISAATKNLHLIALRGLLKFGGILDLPVPGREKVDLAKASQPSPDARHLAEERVKRLVDACDTSSDDGVRARALIQFMLATGCRPVSTLRMRSSTSRLLFASCPLKPEGSALVGAFGRGCHTAPDRPGDQSGSAK